MTLTAEAAWPQLSRTATAKVATANTATNGSGTITHLVTAHADNGSRVEYLMAGGEQTLATTVVRFFISTDDGVNWVYLPVLDALLEAGTVNTTTVNPTTAMPISRTDPVDFLDLAPGDQLGFAITVAPAAGAVVVAAGLKDW